jgi:hypothetical protein
VKRAELVILVVSIITVPLLMGQTMPPEEKRQLCPTANSAAYGAA